MKIFMGRHSGVFNQSGKNVYVNFFLLLPPIFPAAPPAGGAIRGVQGAPSLLARAPGGMMPPCPPPPPGSATVRKTITHFTAFHNSYSTD
jgi:hypothetical protein